MSRLVLHVGTMKSGTTSIQDLLFTNGDALAAQGIVVPGLSWSDQVAAVRELIRGDRGTAEHWPRLLEQIRRHDGTSVISMEYLGTFTEPEIATVTRDLAGVEIEVVITLRDLNRTLVSMWQETVQNGRAWSWADYRSGAAGYRPGRFRRERHRTEAGRTFWRQQDVVRIAGRWADAVGADHVTLITLPPPGSDPELLTRRFAEVVGFDLARLTPAPRRNASLGAASAVVQQRLNARLADHGLATRDGEWLRKEILAKQVLASRARAEPTIGLDVSRWVRRSSDRSLGLLRAAGYRLVGSWDDLVPVEVPGIDPATLASADLLGAAADAFSGLAQRLAERSAERGTAAVSAAWPTEPDLDAGLEALARLVLAGSRS